MNNLECRTGGVAQHAPRHVSRAGNGDGAKLCLLSPRPSSLFVGAGSRGRRSDRKRRRPMHPDGAITLEGLQFGARTSHAGDACSIWAAGMDHADTDRSRFFPNLTGVRPMKMVTAIVKPFKLDEVRE